MGVFEFAVDACEVVEEFVSCFADELVDFIKDEEKVVFFFFKGGEEVMIDFIGGKACCWDFSAVFAKELCDEAVFGVCEFFEFAVKIDYFDRDFFLGCDGLEL